MIDDHQQSDLVPKLWRRKSFGYSPNTYLDSVGEFKTTSSKFHPGVLRLVGIKVHDDTLPDVVVWREVDTAATKDEDPAGLRV
jgi:hypothetical protein